VALQEHLINFSFLANELGWDREKTQNMKKWFSNKYIELELQGSGRGEAFAKGILNTYRKQTSEELSKEELKDLYSAYLQDSQEQDDNKEFELDRGVDPSILEEIGY